MNKVFKIIPVLLATTLLTGCPAKEKEKPFKAHRPEFVEYGDEVTLDEFSEQLTAKRNEYYQNFVSIEMRTYDYGDGERTEPIVLINPAHDYVIKACHSMISYNMWADIRIDSDNKRFRQHNINEGDLENNKLAPVEDLYSEVKNNELYFVDITNRQYEIPEIKDYKVEYSAMTSMEYSKVGVAIGIFQLSMVYHRGLNEYSNSGYQYYINGDVFTRVRDNSIYQIKITATEYSFKQIWFDSNMFEDFLMTKEDVNIEAYDYSNFAQRDPTYIDEDDEYYTFG